MTGDGAVVAAANVGDMHRREPRVGGGCTRGVLAHPYVPTSPARTQLVIELHPG